MIRSSFASFTSAQLAIQASQNALAVVGQNMGNVKTVGYTRQRLDQVSLNLRNVSSLYQSTPDAHIGYGVSVVGVSQIRDPFLDTRYRTEMGNLGTEDKRLDLLTKINGVLDETGTTGLDDQFTDFDKQLSALMSNVDDKGTDNMVRSSAKTLTDMIRKYSDRLKDIENDLVTSTESDVNNINLLLKNIEGLNASIKSSQVHGNPALELQDARNELIDELATYGNMRVSHGTSVTMTGSEVDSIRIDLLDTDGNTINLIKDSGTAAQFSLTTAGDGSGKYEISIKDSIGIMHTDVKSDKGTFKTAINFLNDSGEYDTPSTGQGIGFYRKSLDTLANTFATTFNDLNTVYKTKADGSFETDANGNKIVLKGGALFSNNDGSSVITAANLTISQEWLNGSLSVLSSRAEKPTSGDNTNILNMKNALIQETEFKTLDKIPNTTVYKGSFQKFFSNMGNIVATDHKSTSTALKNYVNISNEISNSKDSVSGVNLDEETMTMMQLNSSLNAASRLMTALDEALNTVINSMGVVGR